MFQQLKFIALCTCCAIVFGLSSVNQLSAQCPGTGPNLVQNPGFETGGAVGVFIDGVSQWNSLFSGQNQADYRANTFGLTGARCAAMWLRTGNTTGTQIYREGIQGTLAPGIKANSGTYCVQMQVARHPSIGSTLNAGPVRLVVYGVKLPATGFALHTNPLPGFLYNIPLLYPSITKVPIASFDVTNIGTTPVTLQAVFNASVMPSGGFINAILITRSDETAVDANAARYMLIDEVSISKI